MNAKQLSKKLVLSISIWPKTFFFLQVAIWLQDTQKIKKITIQIP